MKHNYRSYLLRIWQIHTQPPSWVVSLEDPHTHQVIQFNSIEALLPFLQQMIEQENNCLSNDDGMTETPHG